MSVLDRVPVDRIRAEVEQINVGRALLSLAAAPFYATGWALFWLLVGTLTVVKWIWAALTLGFLDARDRAVQRGVTVPDRLAGRTQQGGRSIGAR